MTSTIERRIFTGDEQLFPSELTTLNGSRGVGIIIIDNAGKVFVGEETQNKDYQGNSVRKVGQLSIPTETKKPDETPLHNIQAGVLEEVIGDKEISLESVGLFILKTPSIRTFYTSIVTVNGDPKVKGDLSILFYDPPVGSDPLQSGGGELTNSRWSRVTDVLRDPAIRPLSKDFLESITNGKNPEDVVTRYQRAYKANVASRIPLFPSSFPRRAFLEERVTKEDLHS